MNTNLNMLAEVTGGKRTVPDLAPSGGKEMDEISATGGHRVLVTCPHRPDDPTNAPLAPTPRRSI